MDKNKSLRRGHFVLVADLFLKIGVVLFVSDLVETHFQCGVFWSALAALAAVSLLSWSIDRSVDDFLDSL